MKKSLMNYAIKTLFLFYIIFLLWRVLFYAYGDYYRHYILTIQVNIIPFRTIYTYLMNYKHVKLNIWFYNLFGNILAFLPFGILLPFIKKSFQSSKYIILTTFISSFIIECLQLILRVGTADIDDLILNTMGGFLGYQIWKAFHKWLVKDKKGDS